MEVKKTFAQIVRQDGKVRLLLGSILLDGALIIALAVIAGAAFIF